jgi:DNA-binding SARP family transcriptional activator
MGVRFYFLGQPRIEVDGEEIRFNRRKAPPLLAYLALNKSAVSREELAALFWCQDEMVKARTALRQVLASINKTPLACYIQAEKEFISLDWKKNIWVDVEEFESKNEQAASFAAMVESIELYRGDLFSGLNLETCQEFDNWQMSQTQILHYKFIRTINLIVDELLSKGEANRALEFIRKWLDIDPFNDDANLKYVRVNAAIGKREIALEHYSQLAALLEEELGVSPSGELKRLYAIIKQNRPISISAADDKILVVPDVPNIVVGREADLEEVNARLTQSNGEESSKTGRVIIQGWPGVGKSALAALLAHEPRLRDHFSDGVLFTSLGEHPNLMVELASWANAVALPEINLITDLETLRSRLSAHLHQRKLLIIVDDIWDAKHIIPFSVGGVESAYVYTSRLNSVANEISAIPQEVYKLPVLSDQAGLELLQRLAPGVVAEKPKEAEELVKSLEGLPLAIQVAGRLMRAEMKLGWGIQELLDDLTDGVGLLKQQTLPDLIAKGFDTSPTVQVLLKRSTDLLSEETRERFVLLGVFAPKPATFDINAIKVVWETLEPKATIRELVSRGLLEPASGQRFQMHSLIVAHAKSMFE